MGNRPKRADTVQIDGLKVRDLRERAGLTQELLAGTVTNLGWHLSQGYLPSVEKKPAARVHKQLATTLADALGVRLNELLATVPQRHKGKRDSKRSGVLSSPLRAEPPPESVSVEATTIGQDIDAVLKEEGLFEESLKEEYDKLRQSLVSHVRQLAQLIKLARGAGDETD